MFGKKKKRTMIVLELDKEVHEKFKMFCFHAETTMSRVLRGLIKEVLGIK